MWLGEAGVRGNYPRFLPSSTSGPRRVAGIQSRGCICSAIDSVALPVDENQRENDQVSAVIELLP